MSDPHDDNAWFDFLDPRYTGPKFEDEPRRIRRKKRRAWDKERRAEKAAALANTVRAQRQNDPIPPQTVFAALVIVAILLAATLWLVPMLLDKNNSRQAAPAAPTTSQETEPTPTPTETKSQPHEKAITAATPDELAKKWIDAYFTRTSASDSDWEVAIREVTTPELMTELENGWPTDSVFTDCTSTSLDSVDFVDAPPDSRADTNTRKTVVANVTANCGDERKQAPMLLEMVVSDDIWKVSRAIEMVSEVME